MFDEEITALGAARRLDGRPMRAAKRIQHDVRYGVRGSRSAADRGSLPLFPPFGGPMNPSYR